jgi:hypothetical protein
MKKQNQILTGLLVLQIILLAIVFWPEPSVASDEQLFDDLSADEIVQLTLHDAQGKQLVLAQKEGKWVLPEMDDYPVLEEPVNQLIDQIVAIRGDRIVAQSSSSHDRLKVSAQSFERLIEFEQQDGTQHKLYLGTSPRYQVLHVRPDDREAVYLALGLTAYEARPEASAWVDTTYLSIARDQIVSFTLANEHGQFKFSKDENDEWSLEGLATGEALNPTSVNSLVNRVANVSLERPLGTEEQGDYGMDDPQAVVTVQTQDEENNENTYVLRVGAQVTEDEEVGYIVKSATSPYFVVAPEYTVTDLIEKQRQDFLQPAATPSPEPTPVSE